MSYEGFIYCVTNIETNQKYIGQTSVSVKNRWIQHKNSAINGCDTYLYRAIRKYGIDSFEVATIDNVCCETEEDLIVALNNLEEKYIAEMNTYSPNGYNMTHGGRSFSKNSSKRVYLVNCEGDVLQEFASFREASRVTGVDEKTISHACRSKTHFGCDMFWYDERSSLKVGENIGEQRRGKNNWKGHRTKPCKPVVMFSKDGQKIKEYPSASVVELDLGIDQATVSKCCLGKRKSAGGYRWAFL